MKRIYRLEELDCANCASKMEAEMAKIAGVSSVSVNFLTAKMTLEFDENILKNPEDTVNQVVHKYESQVRIKRIG